VKSVALSSEVVNPEGEEAEEELTSTNSVAGAVGVVTGAAGAAGVVEAKRTPAPFCIKIFVFERWDLVNGLGIDALRLERSGLALMGPWCTIDEENCRCEQLLGIWGFEDILV
jgi:hypothetical protein